MGQQTTPSLTLAEQALINTAKYAKQSSGICTSKTNGPISFAFMKIYGMHHSCSNNGFLELEDRRRYNTTAERVGRLLDFDILSRLPNNNETNFVVMAGSSLWDLSEDTGCNNQIGVSEGYKSLYSQGIVDLHATIRKHLPESPIYWRTSPAISVQYDRQNERKRLGRTRANQQALNNILKETVSTYNLGIVVDWWSQASHRPENDRGYIDGRHYQPIPSLVFYNMFLNAVFDHHPSLLR
jgi:hypothetical protein